MEFNLSSLLIGVVIGALVAFLLKLNSLRRLELNLKKLGVFLGVEGFEEQPTSGVRIGDIGGDVSGDIAGGDIVKSSNFYRNLQQVIAGSINRRLKMRRLEHLQFKSDDSDFAAYLERLRERNRNKDWFPLWIQACLNRPEIKRQIDQKLNSFRKDGWDPVLLGLDNIPGGIHLNVELERDYPLPDPHAT
jgi:hypothetical protein